MSLEVNLKTIRKRWRMDQQQIADLLGVTRGMWSQYERGGSVPAISLLAKLEELTGHSMYNIFSTKIENDVLPLDPLKEPIQAATSISYDQVEEETAIYNRLKGLVDLNVLLKTVAENAEAIKKIRSELDDRI